MPRRRASRIAASWPGTTRSAGSATPARRAAAGSATSARASSCLVVRGDDQPRAALGDAVDRLGHRGPRRPRRGDCEDGPAGRDGGDRAVHQVGAGVRLEEEARELADLQRDLERGAVVDAARDDRPAVEQVERLGRVARKLELSGRVAPGIASSSPSPAPVVAAKSSAIAPSELMYVLVAATACSSPASIGSTSIAGERRAASSGRW